MSKRKYNKIKTKNKNKNTNYNKNNNTIHIHLNNKKQLVHHKQHVKKEIVQVPQIKTFTPLHQMTNYVPIPGIQIPQVGQMMNQPAIQIQQPLVGHNPLLNPLRDISGRNRTIEDVFNDRKQLREEQYNRQKEETEKRLKEQFGKMEEEMGKKVHDMFVTKQESKLDPYFSTPFDEDEEEQGDLPIIPKICEGQQPTPKHFYKQMNQKKKKYLVVMNYKYQEVNLLMKKNRHL